MLSLFGNYVIHGLSRKRSSVVADDDQPDLHDTSLDDDLLLGSITPRLMAWGDIVCGVR